jgi:aromatic ring-opening dioxygenase LigB subunit
MAKFLTWYSAGLQTVNSYQVILPHKTRENYYIGIILYLDGDVEMDNTFYNPKNWSIDNNREIEPKKLSEMYIKYNSGIRLVIRDVFRRAKQLLY